MLHHPAFDTPAMNRAEDDEIAKAYALNAVRETAAAFAAAVAEAHELGAISQDRAECTALELDEYGAADALADVLAQMRREAEARMPIRPAAVMALHDATVAALTKGDR